MKKNHIAIISAIAVIVGLVFFFSILNGQKSLATKSAKAAVSNQAVPPAPINQPAGRQADTQTETQDAQKLPEKKGSEVIAAKLPDFPKAERTHSITRHSQKRILSLREKSEEFPAAESPAEKQQPTE